MVGLFTLLYAYADISFRKVLLLYFIMYTNFTLVCYVTYVLLVSLYEYIVSLFKYKYSRYAYMYTEYVM